MDGKVARSKKLRDAAESLDRSGNAEAAQNLRELAEDLRQHGELRREVSEELFSILLVQSGPKGFMATQTVCKIAEGPTTHIGGRPIDYYFHMELCKSQALKELALSGFRPAKKRRSEIFEIFADTDDALAPRSAHVWGQKKVNYQDARGNLVCIIQEIAHTCTLEEIDTALRRFSEEEKVDLAGRWLEKCDAPDGRIARRFKEELMKARASARNIDVIRKAVALGSRLDEVLRSKLKAPVGQLPPSLAGRIKLRQG